MRDQFKSEFSLQLQIAGVSSACYKRSPLPHEGPDLLSSQPEVSLLPRVNTLQHSLYPLDSVGIVTRLCVLFSSVLLSSHEPEYDESNSLLSSKQSSPFSFEQMTGALKQVPPGMLHMKLVL